MVTSDDDETPDGDYTSVIVGKDHLYWAVLVVFCRGEQEYQITGVAGRGETWPYACARAARWAAEKGIPCKLPEKPPVLVGASYSKARKRPKNSR